MPFIDQVQSCTYKLNSRCIKELEGKVKTASRQKTEDDKRYKHEVNQKTGYQKAFYGEEAKVVSLKQEIDLLKSQLEEAKQKRPKLTGFFQDLTAYGWAREWIEPSAEKSTTEDERPEVNLPSLTKPTGTLVVLKVGFVNENPTPTTLENFSLTIRIGDKTFTAKYPEELFKPQGWTPPEIEAEEKKKVYLVNYLNTSKTAEQGHRIQGFLTFYFDGFMWQEFKEQDWFFTLTITDAWEEKHEIVHWGEHPRPSQRINR